VTPVRSSAARVLLTGLVAVAAAAATWALFMRLAPDLDFGLVFFTSLTVGVGVEALASTYLKRSAGPGEK
jgi:hypothetical protein